jgi:hypothetical protein
MKIVNSNGQVSVILLLFIVCYIHISLHPGHIYTRHLSPSTAHAESENNEPKSEKTKNSTPVIQ